MKTQESKNKNSKGRLGGTTIEGMPRIERPRERLERYGPEKLSNTELLAIILDRSYIQ